MDWGSRGASAQPGAARKTKGCQVGRIWEIRHVSCQDLSGWQGFGNKHVNANKLEDKPRYRQGILAFGVEQGLVNFGIMRLLR